MSDYPLILTPVAQQHIKAILGSGESLRISLKRSGCAGFSYVFDCVTQKNPGDYLLLHSGTQIFIDPTVLAQIKGSTLDYISTGFNSKKLEIINNQNEKNRCGCGESVSF